LALGSALVAAGPAAAAEPSAVRLKPPGQRGAALRPTVTVFVGARDCSAPPTVSIVATWGGTSGRAILVVSGLTRMLRGSPRRVSRSVDRVTFRRVRSGRVAGVFVTDWRTSEAASASCEISLPRLVGPGLSASAAAQGEVRLRTPLDVQASVAPRRVTGQDHVWNCGGSSSAKFDCGVTVTLGTVEASSTGERVADVPTVEPAPQCPAVETDKPASCPSGCPTPQPGSTPPCDKASSGSEPTSDGGGDDVDDWEKLLLGLLGAAGVGGAGAVASRKQSKKGNDEPSDKPWDEIARQEYAKPDEPISARASDLSKIGAPVAASMAAILAGVGGWISDAPKGETIIAVAIILAVAVGGLFYVFATDFRARSAVAVARFNNLSRHAAAEAPATKTVRDEAAAEAVAVPGQAVPSRMPPWVLFDQTQPGTMGDSDTKVQVLGVISDGTKVTHYFVMVPGEGYQFAPENQVKFPSAND
jgi:hypothetical protein